MPVKVWKAIQVWLEALGWMEGMRAGKYIFTPLAEIWEEERDSQADVYT